MSFWSWKIAFISITATLAMPNSVQPFEHIKACFAGFAAAPEGNNHNIGIVKFFVFTGAFNLFLQIIKVKCGKPWAIFAHLQKRSAVNKYARPYDKAAVAVFAHAYCLNGAAAVTGNGRKHAQQAVGFQAGAGAEAAVCLPVHLAADVFTDNIGRVGNTNHNAFKINLF